MGVGGGGALRKRLSTSSSFSLLPPHPPIAEEELGPSPGTSPVTPHSPPLPSDDASDTGHGRLRTATATTWRSVFHPGAPAIPKPHDASYYDDGGDGGGVWDEVIKAERLAAAARLAREGGDPTIAIAALRKELGGGRDVDALLAAADVRGDGRIEFREFKRALSGKQ